MAVVHKELFGDHGKYLSIIPMRKRKEINKNRK
jgi:hypothetical protein